MYKGNLRLTPAEYVTGSYNIVKALSIGKVIPKDRILKRLAICASCDKMVPHGALMRCSICKCKLKEDGVVNLVRFEEDLDENMRGYGCKHPDGSQWKKAGV